ncbi:MAG: flagellar filament outer layer protein FlaA [Spirochaetaceae bacterium]|nr:flagellar filament outer layer protein FlaA [Spirochaetaceae bacterium]
MKRTFILVAMAFLLVGMLAAEEAVIIDFTNLSADIIQGADGQMTQNRRTTMDYSVSAGATFTDQQKSLMKSSLAFKNWEVVLNSSARTAVSTALSQTAAAPVKADARVPFAGKEILGARIVFPTSPVNANARIVPPFDIPAFEAAAEVNDNGEVQPAQASVTQSTRFEGGYGVLKNVGTIKALSVTTQGMNYPHGLYVLLKDSDGVEKRYFMGYLNFDGWKELKWTNPAYIQEVRAREIRLLPIYPTTTPYVKFAGFLVTRDAADIGGDFVCYFKDVKAIYDKAVLTTERDIADEDIWGIVSERERAKQNLEMTNFGQKQVYRFLEAEKQATENAFSSSLESEVR